jgi:WD40 repeat protein
VITVAFSPDGRRLASGDEAGQVRLWEIAEGRSIFSLQASTRPLVDLAFSPDGKWLAIVGSDGTVRREPMALGDLIERAHGRISRPLTPQERRIYLHSD